MYDSLFDNLSLLQNNKKMHPQWLGSFPVYFSLEAVEGCHFIPHEQLFC